MKEVKVEDLNFKFNYKLILIMDTVKDVARNLIDSLPEQATWDDIMYEFYVKRKIDVALKAADGGRIVSHEEVKKRFLSR